MHIEAANPKGSSLQEADWISELHTIDRYPSAWIARLDAVDGPVDELLAKIADYPGWRGFRVRVGERHDENERLERNFGGLFACAELLNERSGVLEFAVGPYQLGQVADLAKIFPELRIVVDHLGMVASDAGERDRWPELIQSLSKHQNCSVKLSGLWRISATWDPEALRPFLDKVLSVFGASRCLYGSNYPVERAYLSIQSQLTALRTVFETQPSRSVEMMMAENAREIYRL